MIKIISSDIHETPKYMSNDGKLFGYANECEEYECLNGSSGGTLYDLFHDILIGDEEFTEGLRHNNFIPDKHFIVKVNQENRIKLNILPDYVKRLSNTSIFIRSDYDTVSLFYVDGSNIYSNGDEFDLTQSIKHNLEDVRWGMSRAKRNSANLSLLKQLKGDSIAAMAEDNLLSDVIKIMQILSNWYEEYDLGLEEDEISVKQ